jgi:hypothetical protein
MNLRILCIVLLSAAHSLDAFASFRLGALRVGNTTARSIAMDPTVPGKGKVGQCLLFALALNKKLQAAGVFSKVIGYHYANLGDARAPLAGGHAVVSYIDQGRAYIMDNQSSTPVWIKSGSASAMVGQLEGLRVRIVRAWDVRS